MPLGVCADFNPRSREGSDGADTAFSATEAAISIHAPARGATLSSSFRVSISSDFNPRSREGSDCCTLVLGIPPQHFNPRSREGSDASLDGELTDQDDFNPRSREGSDLENLYQVIAVDAISIHAPARGATKECRRTGEGIYYFNPRSREGSDA